MTASKRIIRLLPIAVLLVLVSLAACHKKEEEAPPPAAAPAPAPAAAPAPAPAAAPLTVASLTLGNAVGADKKVGTELDTFGKNDTIYASVGTTGAGTTKLTAKWSYMKKNGTEEPIKSDDQSISPTDAAWTEFHVSKPSGWPAGDYKVEILQDGKSIATKAFRVGK